MILDGSNGISGLPVPLPLNQGGTGQTLTASGVVKQGGGVGQLGNQIYIGWTGSDLLATVDTTNVGTIIGIGGYGYTWQTFNIGAATGQRQAGYNYINNTQHPIMIAISMGYASPWATGAVYTLTLNVNGNAIVSTYTVGGYTAGKGISLIIPTGATYSATASGTINSWSELS